MSEVLTDAGFSDVVARGDSAAVVAAVGAYRPYLRHLAAVRYDDRLRGRVDESDLVQDTLSDAVRSAAGFAANPTLPLRLWLRQLFLDALIAAQRRHLGADARAAGREVPLPAGSVVLLSHHLFAADPTPGSEAAGRERTEMVRYALGRLEPADREVILLRAFERLTTNETAELMGTTPAAASKRFVRALGRLRAELTSIDPNGSGS
jgi:RNA polymerase sigma-70 factor, ECF subfamily